MSFELSREHEEFRRSVRNFAEAEIVPNVYQWDRDHHFPVDLVHKMGALGLFGLTAPEEYEPEVTVDEPFREANPADVAEQAIELPDDDGDPEGDDEDEVS